MELKQSCFCFPFEREAVKQIPLIVSVYKETDECRKGEIKELFISVFSD